MPDIDAHVPTWKDFPMFYENPFVKQIAGLEKWTVSDNTKRPIDMYALIHKNKVWGMAFNRGYHPLVDLKTLCEVIPNATNNAFYLDALSDNFVVLDIEPKCPDYIKQKFLDLPYLYGETSMSGKGIHLVFELPKYVLSKYPDAAKKIALKDEHGYYEILLNHMVTFTRNALPPANGTEDISVFNNIFELLAMKAKPSVSAAGAIHIEDMDTNNIPNFDKIIPVLRGRDYKKTPADFYNDMSRYEFGISGFYYKALNRLLKNEQLKGHDYTDEEKALIVYSVVKDKIEFREKHDTIRDGMPWLLYNITNVIAKSLVNDSSDNDEG